MKPVNDTRSPAAIRQARYRERKKLRETRETQDAGSEVIAPAPRPKISEGLLAASRRRPSRSLTNPFSVGSLHPPSVGSPGMAMDEVTQQTVVWAGSQFSALIAEGQTFLGYPVLAEMAQRPEYRRVSEVIARHMTRKWIKLTATGDLDKSERIQQIEDKLTALGVKDVFKQAAEMDGLFGRGHIHIDLGNNDPNELMTPIGDGWNYMSRTKVAQGSIKAIRAIEPVWCYPLEYNSADPISPFWYKPRTWMVMSKKLHASRLLTLIGREVPDLLKPAYSFGGLSLSQMVKPYVDNWLRTRQSVSDLIHSFSVSGIKTSVNDALLTNDDQLLAKADFFNNMRDNRGLLFLDKDTEDFFNVSTPLGTLDKLQAQALENIASICAIPLVELLGTTPTGLNASSEGEIRVFQEMIHANQENLFREPLTSIIGFIMLDLFGEVDEDIDFEFEPLWDMGEDEKANIRKTDADTDSVLVNAGIISVEESRQRIAADPNTVYAGLNPQAKPELEEQKKSEIAQRDTQSVAEAFSQAIIDHATALEELRKIAQRTGRFVNVTQRDIWEAEAEPPPMPAMGAGMPGMEGLPGAGRDPFSKSPGATPGKSSGLIPSLSSTSSSSTTTARDGLALDFDPSQPRDSKGRWTSTGSFEIPTKTVKAYKLLAIKRSRPGEYFATQINTAAPIRVGEWIPAENHPTKGFAARPGWHAGLLPLAPQMRAKSGMRRPDRVWAEVELPDDRSQEWQAAAAASPTRDLPGAIPVGGHYVYEPPSQKRFNSKWLIGGGLKINRILKHDEVRRILEEAGASPEDIAAETHDYPLAHDGAPIVAAGMMFRTPDDKVLLLKRKDGTWGFPGGSIEPGETPQWAAEREVHEETRAQVDYELDSADEPYALTRTPDGEGMFATFLMAVNEPFEPLLNDEHSEHVWASLDDLPQPLHPGVIEAIDGKTQAQDEFIESEHPRGQPKNKGQFRKKGSAAPAKTVKPGGVNSEFERTSNLFDAFYNYVTERAGPVPDIVDEDSAKRLMERRALIDGFPKDATYKEQLAYVEEHVGKENLDDILEATRIMRSHDEGAFNELLDWAKNKKSGDYRFFHGTSSAAVESIMQKGLIPQGGPGGDAWASKAGMTVSGFTIGDRAASVYVTPDPDFAKDFALYAAEITGSRAALLEVRIPADRAPDIFYDERSTGGGIRFKGTIPPEWINNRTIEAFGMDEERAITIYLVIPCTESDADEIAQDRDVSDEPRAPAGRPDGGQWVKVGGSSSTELRIPQRLPTGVRSPERGKGPKELTVTLAAMRGDHLEGKQKTEAAEQFHHNMQLIKSYVGFKPADGASDDETARDFIDECKGNLIWLYDKMPEDRRERAKLWYVGANRIAREKAKEYGLPLQSVAGCYAALSPQKDWFMNVSLGDRVMDLYFNHHADKWDDAMDSTAERLLAVEEKGAKGVKTSKGTLARALPRIRGKSLDDIKALDMDSDAKLSLEAAWIRIKDEANPDRTHPAITPEGEYGEPVKNLAGEPKVITWGTYVATATAIECLASGGDMQRISAAMGEKHKVRNFYNNIVDPESDLGDVTIDTHAVAAARLRPLSGSDPEVMHALHSGGNKGAMNTTGSSITGVKGLYPLYAEAYREAAQEVGVLPREMQSITWEEIRSMFPPTLKRDRGKIDKATGEKTVSKPAQINAIWSDYTDGKRSIDSAREAIGELAPAGEISWE